MFVVGGATPTGAGASIRTASVVVALAPKSGRARSQKAIEEALSRRLASIPDLHGWLVNDRGERELSMTVLGDEPVALNRAVARLEGAMRRLPGFRDVAASAGVDRPEIRVTPRNEEASRFGVTTEAIADAVRIGTIGDVPANLAKFRDGDRLIPIRVQLDPAARARPGRAGGAAGAGHRRPGGAAGGGGRPGLRQRPVLHRAVRPGAPGADRRRPGSAARRWARRWPRSTPCRKRTTCRPACGCRAAAMPRSWPRCSSGFASAMGAGLLLVLAVLVLLFGDVFQPVTILLSLPLSIGGVILALLVTGQALSMPVVIGVLMLIGIVTKNAIMLVDFAIEARAQGMPRRQAITEAGSKRARPIVMTTVAMVAGMVPSALGIGDGGEFRAPMAIGVIGGLIVSTLLSLVFVPSFYTVMDDLSGLGRRLFRGRRVAAADAVQAPAE